MPILAQQWEQEARTHQAVLSDLVNLVADLNVLQALQVIDELCDSADLLRTAAVKSAKEQGATWEEIGTALGLARQTVWERYKTTVEVHGHPGPSASTAMNGSRGS